MENKKAYMWAMIGNFTPHALAILTNMVLARYILPEEYGKIAVLNIFIAIATTLLDSGLGGSLIKEKNVSKIDYSSISVFNISVSIIIYVLIFLASGRIETYFNIDGLKNIARWLCLCFVINSFGLVPKAILIRNINFKAISKINIFSYVVSSTCAIVFGIIYRNAVALVVNQLVNAFVQVILLVKSSGYKFSFEFSYDSFKRLISFGIYTTVTSVIDSIYENMIAVIFGKVYNAQQAGYVSQAKRIEELSSRTVANTINNVAFPILVKYKNDRDAFLLEANKVYRTILLITIPILCSIALFSDTIVYILWGDKWILSAEYLRLLMFAGVFILVESLNRNFLKALTIVDQLLNITILKRIIGVSIIILTATYCPRLLLQSYIVSSFVGYMFNNFAYSRYMQISFWSQLFDFFKILIPNIIYYILILLISLVFKNTLVQIVIAILYLVIYFFFIIPMYGIDIRHYFTGKARS